MELALESKELQNYLWSSKDSALATWLRRGADGARLDVASEIGASSGRGLDTGKLNQMGGR